MILVLVVILILIADAVEVAMMGGAYCETAGNCIAELCFYWVLLCALQMFIIGESRQCVVVVVM